MGIWAGFDKYSHPESVLIDLLAAGAGIKWHVLIILTSLLMIQV